MKHVSEATRRKVPVAYLFIMLVAFGTTHLASRADANALPQRVGPPPYTSSHVPHIQVGVDPVPEVNAALLRRVSTLPKLDVRPTVVSLPGAKGFWLLEDMSLARPEVIVRGREFAHIHPDGSLHASLPPQRAEEAINAGWAVWHPWAKQREGWEGFVMLYTPRSMEELDVTFQLIVDGYNYVTGQELKASDY